ncbi:MAG: dihydrodipicolinate synthase family protein [Rhodothermales bacterium]
MNTQAITPKSLKSSVIAAPPLARKADLSVNHEENRKIIRFLEEGGLTTFLYAANANFYHVGLGEYASILEFLEETVSPNSTVIPAIGPAFGTMIAQARTLRRTAFPVALLLPATFAADSEGIEFGIRRLIDELGKPVIVEINQPDMMDPGDMHRLVRDGLVAAIVYSVRSENPIEDPYLRRLTDRIEPSTFVSGCGEFAAITHMRDFGMSTFVSGCVCVAPRLARKMHRAIQDGDYEIAENVRELFVPLDRIMEHYNPVRVVHEAVHLARIADAGALLPFLSNLEREQQQGVLRSVQQLMVDNVNFGV